MRNATSVLTCATAVLLAACGGGGGGGPTAPAPPSPPAAGSVWDPVTAAVDAAFARNIVPGLGVAVYAQDGQLLYSRVRGDFALDRNIAVASASKMVSGVAILRLVDRGFLSLDSTTGAVLGWTGPQAAITLRHLLSFTSGLPVSFRIGDDCTAVLSITLAQCVADLATRPLLAAPGARFDYGSTHLAVAARMAEVITGSSWAQIVTQQLGQPLGWSASVAYYTAPRQQLGTINPLVAGGLRITTQEYARFLGVIYNRGALQGQQLLASALVDQMGVDPYPVASTGFSPYERFGLAREYGLTAWLECGTPATGCQDITSPGAFGFTPWIDRNGRYYAIVAMESQDLGEISQFSVQLSLDLRPLIRAAVAR
jgi:CubicO group peptidase (beta-lactamase class C family)